MRRWWQLPYYWAGIKMYDIVAGSKCLKSSYVLSKSKALEFFPMLKKDKLVGAIVYYDGECVNDSARVSFIWSTRITAKLAPPSTSTQHCISYSQGTLQRFRFAMKRFLSPRYAEYLHIIQCTVSVLLCVCFFHVFHLITCLYLNFLFFLLVMIYCLKYAPQHELEYYKGPYLCVCLSS